jgi:hypothetical protein
MTIRLRIPRSISRQLHTQLDNAPEQMTFVKGRRSRLRRHSYVVTHILDLDQGDVDHRPHHGLTDADRQRFFAWAAESGDILIEAHSHGRGNPATFSHIDVEGLTEWVPHVRWRLSHRPYAALVFASKSYDGLAWLDSSGPIPVTSIYFGARLVKATGRSIRLWRPVDV